MARTVADHSKLRLYTYGSFHRLSLSSLCHDKIVSRTLSSSILEKLLDKWGRDFIEYLLVVVDIVDVLVFVFVDVLVEDFEDCSSFNWYSNTLSMFNIYSLRSSNNRAFLSFVNVGLASALENFSKNFTFSDVVFILATFLSIIGVNVDTSIAWEKLVYQKIVKNKLSIKMINLFIT